jgi:CRISPR/Cas system endoribonuclease Cas6 (RAMP superfamily)
MEASSIFLSGSFHGCVNPERIEKGMDRPSMAQTKGFFVNLLVPPLVLRRIVSAMYSKDSNKKSNMLTVGAYTFLYLVWIALFRCRRKEHGVAPLWMDVLLRQ